MTSIRKCTHLNKMSETVALLSVEQLSRIQIAERSGIEYQTVCAHIKALRSVGMARCVGFTEHGGEVFRLQSAPFAEPDSEPAPENHRVIKRRQHMDRMAELNRGKKPRNQDSPAPGNAGSGPAPRCALMAPASWIVPGL